MARARLRFRRICSSLRGATSTVHRRRDLYPNADREGRRKVRAIMGARTFPPVVITEELWGRILEKASGDSVVRSRNRALLHVIYYCGLRISEALDLRGDDVDLDSRTVRVRRGKGGKFRIVALPDPAADALAPLASRSGRGLVFATSSGEHVRSCYVRAWLKRLAAKVGVERLHAHGARHGHALYLANKGVQLHLIRDQLGHSNISTTDRYIARLSPKVRVEAVCNAYK